MEDAELYQKSNSLQRRDAIQCLDTHAREIRWRKFDRVIDIGCGDGGVSDILKTYMPIDSNLLGCDISEKMIDFANGNHGDKRTEFIVLDIEGKLPFALRESFDHAFSFYALHWIKNQEMAFRNIYKLLAENGDCLLMFLGHMPIFDVYRRLARNNKWGAWLGDVDRYVSPYHDSQEPEKQITKLLDKIGFSKIDVKCKKLEYKYESLDILKKAVAAINPFNIPKDLFDDFMEDYFEVISNMRMVDLANNNIGEDMKIRSWKTQNYTKKNNSLQRRDAIQCLDTHARKIKWRKLDRVIDIVCGDGGVSDILKTYMPIDSNLLGCDKSEKIIDFANSCHRDKRTKFLVLDIEEKLSHTMRESFDHAFSFYALHWIKNQEMAFRNIYKLLAENGDCLLMFLGHMPIFDVYRRLARKNKWGAWLGDVDRYVSPYHDSQEPEKQLTEMLDKIGFNKIDVKCKQVEYKYDSVDSFNKALSATCPFNLPKDIFEDFVVDVFEEISDMEMVDLANNIGEAMKIRISYTVITVNASKTTLVE